MIIQFISAFISTAGFSVLFNIPRKDIIKASFIGSVGWLIYQYTQTHSLMLKAFLAAFVIGILGELFSKIFKEPVTIFIIPGIIPIVPGYGLYYTMLKIIESDYESAATIGFESILIALLIASGLMVSTALSQLMKSIINRDLLTKS